jgi:hypothetical protein
MSVVYKAEDTKLKRSVARKSLYPLTMQVIQYGRPESADGLTIFFFKTVSFQKGGSQ